MITGESKIYIAGHTGMVGSAIVRCLKRKGYHNLLLKEKSELDLMNQQLVRKFLHKENPEYVILSAARVGGIEANITYPAEFLYENLQIQNNIIWGAHEIHVKKLVFLGSSCIYPRQCPQPMKEEYLLDGKPEPTNEGYALAKIAGIKLCEKIYEEYGEQFISCMPTNIYGKNDNFDQNSSHVIPALMSRMHKAKKNGSDSVIIWGSGKSRREFLYVDDLADAVVFLLENYGQKMFLNIGTEEDISIRDLSFLLKEVVGYRGKLVFDITKPDGMPKKLLDSSRIHSLGWRQRIDLKTGLDLTYTFYKDILRQSEKRVLS